MLARDGRVRQRDLIRRIAPDGGRSIGQLYAVDSFTGFVNDRDPIRGGGFHSVELNRLNRLNKLNEVQDLMLLLGCRAVGSIPKGLHLSAQGREERATLGETNNNPTNPERVAARPSWRCSTIFGARVFIDSN